MVQARPFEIDGVVVPGHYVIIADDVVLLQADYNIVAMKRGGNLYMDKVYGCIDQFSVPTDSVVKFLGINHSGKIVWLYDLNNGDLIR